MSNNNNDQLSHAIHSEVILSPSDNCYDILGVPEFALHSRDTLALDMSSTSNSLVDQLGCFVYMMPHTKDNYCIRVNTIRSYVDANRDVARGITSYTPYEEMGKNNYIAATAEVDPRTQVCIVILLICRHEFLPVCGIVYRSSYMIRLVLNVLLERVQR